MGVTVSFSNLEEFLDELADRRPDVEPVVRCSFIHKQLSTTLPIVQLVLVATYLRQLPTHTGGIVSVVELKQFVGDEWPGKDEVRKRALAERDILLAACAELGIEVRDGLYRLGEVS